VFAHQFHQVGLLGIALVALHIGISQVTVAQKHGFYCLTVWKACWISIEIVDESELGSYFFLFGVTLGTEGANLVCIDEHARPSEIRIASQPKIMMKKALQIRQR